MCFQTGTQTDYGLEINRETKNEKIRREMSLILLINKGKIVEQLIYVRPITCNIIHVRNNSFSDHTKKMHTIRTNQNSFKHIKHQTRNFEQIQGYIYDHNNI